MVGMRRGFTVRTRTRFGPRESVILVRRTPGETQELRTLKRFAPEALIGPPAWTASVQIVKKAATASFPAPLRFAIVRMLEAIDNPADYLARGSPGGC